MQKDINPFQLRHMTNEDDYNIKLPSTSSNLQLLP